MSNEKNTNEDALRALEDAMKLLGENKTADENGGVCVWVAPSGKSFCAPISQSDCAKIKGSSWVPDGKC